MSYLDIAKKYKRGPQVITRKDAAIIAGETGLRPNWRCLDLGGGSGFLALFLANLVPNGSVTCYELRKEHAEIIKQNVKTSGFTNVKVVNKSADDFTGKNFDLITVDMKGAETVVEKAHRALKVGGFIAVYSPHIEQQIECRKALERCGFTKIKTSETVQKEWTSVHGFTHPVPSQLVHTGFVTIARKLAAAK